MGRPIHTMRAAFASTLLIWTNKPIAAVFPHHYPLIDKLAAQAGNVIMKRLENGVDFFFVIETTPFERVCQFFHHITPFLVLGRNAHQVAIFDKGRYHASSLIT